MNVEIHGIEKLERALGRLMGALGPGGRRAMLLKVGQAVRRENAARITRNVAPDGSPFAPRKESKPAKNRTVIQKPRTARKKGAPGNSNVVKHMEIVYQGKRESAPKRHVLKNVVDKGKVLVGYSVTSRGVRTFVKERIGKANPRASAGRLRKGKKMFRRLATTKKLRIERGADSVAIRFPNPRDARIAAVHHYGLREKVSKKKWAKYPARPLLGLTAADREKVMEVVTGFLADRLR